MPAWKKSAVVIAWCLGAGLVIILFQQRYALSTLATDHAAVRAWLTGGDLYATRPGTALTPAAALLLTPLVLAPLALAGGLLAAAGLAALVLALIALVGPVARRYGKPRNTAVLAAVILALLIEPVRATLGIGGLDLLLFGLITADVVALRRSAWARSRAAWWPGAPLLRRDPSPPHLLRHDPDLDGPLRHDPDLDGPLRHDPNHPGMLWRDPSLTGSLRRGPNPAAAIRRGWATGAWAGVGTGIATALAVSPILFIVYLVVSRQWRAATTAAATAATLLGGAFLLAPGTTTTWLSSALPHLDRSGPLDAPANQSLAGVLARLYDSTTTPVLIWLSFAGLLIAVGMIRARGAHTDGDEIAAFTLIGLTSAAVGPVSRINELIWILPAVLILVDAAARHRATTRRPRPRRIPGAGHALAAALVLVLFALDPRWTTHWNGYAFALIMLLNALPWRPGVAPAVPARRRPQPVTRRAPAIPGPRGR